MSGVVLAISVVAIVAVGVVVELVLIVAATVSAALVDLLMDVLAGIARAMPTDIGVVVLASGNVNAFAGVTAAFEFEMSDSSKEFCC